MVVFFLIGVSFLIVYGSELVRRIVRRRHFVRAEGLIVGVLRKVSSTSSRGRKPRVMHCPTIKFSKQTGEVVTFTSETGDAGPASRYAPGQRIAIFYDPEGGPGPMIATWSGVWLTNLSGVLVGVMLLCVAFLIYWAFWEKIIGGGKAV
jgi:hypothetical protein